MTGGRILTAWRNHDDSEDAEAGAMFVAEGIQLLRVIASALGGLKT